MNFVVRNKKIPRRTVNRRLDANAQAWLAQFPGACDEAGSRDVEINNNIRLTSTIDQLPPTVSSSSFLLSSSTNIDPLVYLALSLGRGHASTEVGLATLDVQSPSLVLSQFSDDLWFNGLLTKISICQPRHLLLPNTLCDIQPPPRIITYIRNNFPEISIIPLDRSKFNNQRGLEQLQLVCAARYAPLIQKNQQLYYAMTSAAALLDYVQHHVVRASFGERTLRLQIESKAGSMLIDVESAHRLELLYSLYPSQERRTCLYGVVNTCTTRIGQRNLRAKVLQPSCDLALIRTMHECVAELTDKDRQIADLQQLLGPFLSVDRLARIAYVVPPNKDDNYRVSELLINQALQLKTCLESIPDIFKILVDMDGTVFAQIREGLQDPRYPYLAKKIHEVVDSNGGAGISRGGTQFFQRLYAVRPGINGMLDLNRTIYTALVDDIRAEVQKLKDTYNAPLRLTYSKGRQFHVQMPLRSGVCVDRMVAELEVLSRNKNMLLLTNEALCRLNIRIKKYIDEIHFTSTAILCDLLQSIRQEMDIIYDLTGHISELDITLAIVKLSLSADYCRPTFGDDLRLVQAIHPFLEYASHKTHSQSVPNNVLATAEYNFFIITGPNMGGKTIYLKMIALLQILAQIGCYVPAKSAQFRICDKVFTRMGFNDCIEQNASSYVVEMREMDYILKSVTPNSLVIIDELCRSTNANDGQRIAWKICEQLVQIHGPKIKDDVTANNAENELEPSITNEAFKSHTTMAGSVTAPFVFFTTHFPALCRLYDRYLNVVNLNFVAVANMTADNKLHLTYTHQLEEGVTPIKGYGLALARTVRFPPSILPRAEAIHSFLIRNESSDHLSIPSNVAPLIRHRSSNPIHRTFSSSNQTHSANQLYQPNTLDISADKRNLYDLYANIMEVVRGDENADAFRDAVNTLMMQFMEHCEPDLERALTLETVEILLQQYFGQQIEDDNERTPSDMQYVEDHNIEQNLIYDLIATARDDDVHNEGGIEVPISEKLTNHHHSIIGRRPARTDNIFNLHPQHSPLQFPETSRPYTTHANQEPDELPNAVTGTSRTDRSVTFCENVQFRDIEIYPSEVPLYNSNRTYNWSEHSLISNLNYGRRQQSARPTLNWPNSSSFNGYGNREDDFFTSNVDNHEPTNIMTQRSQEFIVPSSCSPARRIPSDTETNMSRPSFKSFIRTFTRPLPTQFPPQTLNSSIDQRLRQAPRQLPPKPSNPLSFCNTQSSRKSNPIVPPKTINYFADMPDTFWKSMDEFENGSQFQELRDFVNEGIPPAWSHTNSRCLDNLFDGISSSVADAQYQASSQILSNSSNRPCNSQYPREKFVSVSGFKRPGSIDEHEQSQEGGSDSFSSGTPNIFKDLENYVNRTASDQASLPKRSRPDPMLIAEDGQAKAIPNTQNTINFLVEFESTLSDSMDPIFDIPTASHSIFDLTPADKHNDNPMEQDDMNCSHRTQSRDTESSFNEMDPTQHVVALISQLSSQTESNTFLPEVQEVPPQSTGNRGAESTSFIFKMPGPPLATPRTTIQLRPTLCASPTKSENLQRVEEYVESQYDRAIVHQMPSSSTSSATAVHYNPPPDQYAEIHSTSSQSPTRSSSSIVNSASFRTPMNQRIRTPRKQTTFGGVADSLRRFIESNRDSDEEEEEEDMFADSLTPTQELTLNQVGIQSFSEDDNNEVVNMETDADVQMVEIIIPAPTEFQ